MNLLLERPGCTDKNIRLKACKDLGRASGLSNQVTDSSELSALASEPEVSHAGYTVLQPHKLKKILTRLSIWMESILCTGFILFMLYLISLTSRLTCERVGLRAPVDCVEQVYFFSLIPLYQREFRDVHSAGIWIAIYPCGDRRMDVKYDYPQEAMLYIRSQAIIGAIHQSSLAKT